MLFVQFYSWPAHKIVVADIPAGGYYCHTEYVTDKIEFGPGERSLIYCNIKKTSKTSPSSQLNVSLSKISTEKWITNDTMKAIVQYPILKKWYIYIVEI